MKNGKINKWTSNWIIKRNDNFRSKWISKSNWRSFWRYCRSSCCSAAAAAPAEEVAEGPKEVSVYLVNVGQAKIPVIKAVQAITGKGLLEAKKLCDALPALLKEKITPEQADAIKAQLVEQGAEVEVK